MKKDTSEVLGYVQIRVSLQILGLEGQNPKTPPHAKTQTSIFLITRISSHFPPHKSTSTMYPNSPNRQKQSSYAKPISHPSPVKDGLSYKGALEKRSPTKKLSSDDTSSPLKSKVKANGQTPSRVSWQDNNNISSNEGNGGSDSSLIIIIINPPPLLFSTI